MTPPVVTVLPSFVKEFVKWTLQRFESSRPLHLKSVHVDEKRIRKKVPCARITCVNRVNASDLGFFRTERHCYALHPESLSCLAYENHLFNTT